MFFHSKDLKSFNEKDCKIVLEIETREGFAPMYRVRFTDGKKPVDVIAFAHELKGEKDYVSDEDRAAYIAERDSKNPVKTHKLVERDIDGDGAQAPQDS